MTLSLELLEEHRMFGGWQQRYRHAAQSLNCNMTFSITCRRRDDNPPPVLYWLSGLTCNDENFTLKAGAQRIAAELGLVLVMRTPARVATKCRTTKATIWAGAPGST